VRDGEIVSPRRFLDACRNPKDDKFLDAADAGKADCLISRDDDLIALREFERVPILTAKRYLARNVR